MKNKSQVYIGLTLMCAFFSFVNLQTSYANETDEHPSGTRAAIEAAEEKTLGAEKHAELEKIEPSIDNTITRSLPIVIGGIGIVLLSVAGYMKAKKK